MDEEIDAVGVKALESLMEAKGKELDWSLIREYFTLFGMGAVFKELRGKYGKP